MTASLNAAAAYRSHLATARDTREVNADRSSGNGESFSQVLRRTSGDGKSSGANRSHEAEKRDSKSAKKDDDANPTNSAVSNGNAAVVEKSSLPITFLFGLPTEPLQNLDQQSAGNSSPASPIEGQAPGSIRPVPANLSVFPSGEKGDPLLAMTAGSELPGLVPTNNAATPETEESPTIRDNSELLGITGHGDIAKSAAGALSTNNLAFAMRLGNGEAVAAPKTVSASEAASSAASSNTTQINPGTAMPTIVQAASGSSLEENAHQHDPSAQEGNNFNLSAAPVSEHFDPARIGDDQSSTAPATPVSPDPPPAATAEPVRNVHMQLVSDDNRRVDVRLIDRGGELHVSVKSADTALTQNLQDHLPDLTARLETQHMQAEVWVPKATEPAKADSGNTNGSLADPNARSYSGNSESRKDGRQQGRPNWVDALENYS